MFKFHCHSCDETFHIAFENLYNKIAIQCQNCGQALPSEAVKSLRDLSEAYMDTIDTLHSTGKYQECWSLSIVGTEAVIPEKVSKYGNFLTSENDQSYWKHRRKPIIQQKSTVHLEQSNNICNKNNGISDDDLPF
ncbi:hypothetical protein ORM80_00720 [Bacillus cereus]|uniref:hypothetical protein n=1 Tax=Bacillus cereus TaxID=1396 RepID=UPI0001A07E55|nr:hypothetical protein [Bacillus cereus]EEL27617.1 hypothetical protein bcere0018_34130 [Bacillus cereus Rock1-15]MDZ4633229.1 hypothetical protein [Bacillus cereus]